MTSQDRFKFKELRSKGKSKTLRWKDNFIMKSNIDNWWTRKSDSSSTLKFWRINKHLTH